MDPRNMIVSRIDTQLRRHLGQPVDTYRAVSDARYVRDMLLVCDAMTGTDLPALALQYRDADEKTSAARRVLAPRRPSRVPADLPLLPMASGNQRPVSFGRIR
jgi:hypothetical protein